MQKTNDIEISEMTLEDLENINKNLEKDYDNFWSSNILGQEIKSDTSKVYLLKVNGKITGFASISIVLDEAEITNIVVKKSCRGQKLSLILMTILIDYAIKSNCKKIHLEVNENNVIARRLYRKFGFDVVGSRKNYYKNGNAVLMTKDLN